MTASDSNPEKVFYSKAREFLEKVLSNELDIGTQTLEYPDNCNLLYANADTGHGEEITLYFKRFERL
jgi:hypothetical protein